MKDERTLKQEQLVQDWIDSGGRALIEASTGFGKTRIATIAISRFLNKNPDRSVLVIVPTTILKKQWEGILKESNLNAQVLVINTAIKRPQSVDLLIVDEAHKAAAKQSLKLFQVIKFKLFLGLTATLERLDHRDNILRRMFPVVGSVGMEECIEKGWLAPNYNYKLVIEVDDIAKYKEYNRQFINYFSFFNFDFNLAMKCVNDYKARVEYTNLLIKGDKRKFHEVMKQCTASAFSWNKALQKRKEFVAHHPKKMEIAKKILAARPNVKAITFNATIKDCESYGFGYVVHSDKKKKENEAILREFNARKDGCVIHTAKSCNEGLDVKGLSLGIILYNSSSSTERIQRGGRVIRFEPGKTAEIFSIVIKDTIEMNWFAKSSKDTGFIEINEYDLDKILNNEKIYKEKQIQKEVKYLNTV